MQLRSINLVLEMVFDPLMGIPFPELKTEEGYSADIYPWRYMSDQCPHYVRTTSHEDMYVSLVRCCADIYLRGYISALYPSSVFSSGFLFFFAYESERKSGEETTEKYSVLATTSHFQLNIYSAKYLKNGGTALLPPPPLLDQLKL